MDQQPSTPSTRGIGASPPLPRGEQLLLNSCGVRDPSTSESAEGNRRARCPGSNCAQKSWFSLHKKREEMEKFKDSMWGNLEVDGTWNLNEPDVYDFEVPPGNRVTPPACCRHAAGLRSGGQPFDSQGRTPSVVFSFSSTVLRTSLVTPTIYTIATAMF